jgi:cobalt-precorrin 5A hydrolase
MNSENKMAIVAITNNGKKIAFNIKNHISDADIYVSEKIHEPGFNIINTSLSEFVGTIFNKYAYILFIMATGIVVRSIAPYIVDKTIDPGIIVIDEKGNNVISLLSGHIGGANETTLTISRLINANPVITTATDINNKSSLDNICKSINGYIEDFKESVKLINSMLVNDKKVGIYIDGNYEIDTRGFIKINNIKDIDYLDSVVCISYKKELNINHNKVIKVIPRDIVVAIGCRKDTNSNFLYECFIDFINKNNIDEKSIKLIGSVEVKKEEKAILDLSERLKVPFEIISINDINKVEDKFEKSEFVKRSVGVYSVAEPVAYILSNKNLIVSKSKYKGITFAMGRV